jgi:hypothetical protein
MERFQSAGLSQSWPPIKSVPKWPVSSRSATSWSSTRRGLPAMMRARLMVSIVMSSSGTSMSGLSMKSALRPCEKLWWKKV